MSDFGPRCEPKRRSGGGDLSPEIKRVGRRWMGVLVASRRRIERELDLEEASIACKKEGGEEPPL